MNHPLPSEEQMNGTPGRLIITHGASIRRPAKDTYTAASSKQCTEKHHRSNAVRKEHTTKERPRDNHNK